MIGKKFQSPESKELIRIRQVLRDIKEKFDQPLKIDPKTTINVNKIEEERKLTVGEKIIKLIFLLLLLIVVLGAIFSISFYFKKGGGKFSEDRCPIHGEIEFPLILSSGDAVEIKISITNSSNSSISNVKCDLGFVSGSFFIAPVDKGDCVINFGSIGPGLSETRSLNLELLKKGDSQPKFNIAISAEGLEILKREYGFDYLNFPFRTFFDWFLKVILAVFGALVVLVCTEKVKEVFFGKSKEK